MKLDYLRFLELELFTRFGARLEPAMEAVLKRGRVLREILKQERLAPLPIEFQMAWMVGFNDGVFDEVQPEAVEHLLDELSSVVKGAGLALDDQREAWSAAVSAWLGSPRQLGDPTGTESQTSGRQDAHTKAPPDQAQVSPAQ
jgi:F-type H+-transporting ATPase subunit alpha